MTLDEARALIGNAVVYWPNRDLPPEQGIVTSVNDQYVFVRYDGDNASKATAAPMLSPLVPS